MKKEFLIIFIFNLIFNIYSVNNKYNEILFESKGLPLTNNVQKRLTESYAEVDLLLYKSIIRNGNVDLLKELYLSDLQLGVLNKDELRILRNLYYAKEGYIFSDKDLADYFYQFEWYQPKSKNIVFSEFDKNNIQKVQAFENESLIDINFENKNISLTEFTGGADQEGCRILLNKDKSFVYYSGDYGSRLSELYGEWFYKDKSVFLKVSKEAIKTGGFFLSQQMEKYLIETVSAEIFFSEQIIIRLPLSKSKFEKDFGTDCIQIGSTPFFIE